MDEKIRHLENTGSRTVKKIGCLILYHLDGDRVEYNTLWLSDETVARVGLKNRCPKGRTGSTPV